MLHINSILEFIYTGVEAEDPRFTVIDDEHILDTKTGVELHLYDEDVKVTRGGVDIAKTEYFTPEEKATLFEIKKLITDPSVVEKKLADFPIMAAKAREDLSLLFEQPSPLVSNELVAEVGAVEYEG